MESGILTLLANVMLTYIPAYLGNMMPPLAGALKLPFGTPIAPTLLGNHKTYRGIFAGVIGGIVGGWLLWMLQLGWFGNQTFMVAWMTGGLMGLGALVGDAVKSGVKRWRGIPSGRPFVPFDQLDFIVGGTVFVMAVMPISWEIFLSALIITPLLHLLVNILAYHLRLKSVWW